MVLMHHQGDPATMQDAPRYGDVLVEVYRWLEERIAAAEAAGIARAKILVDPGIGFGKIGRAQSRADERPGAVPRRSAARCVLGASRKRMIGALSNEAPADQRLAGSLALALKAAEQGAQIDPRPRRPRNGPGAQGLARPSRPGADAARGLKHDDDRPEGGEIVHPAVGRVPQRADRPVEVERVAARAAGRGRSARTCRTTPSRR